MSQSRSALQLVLVWIAAGALALALPGPAHAQPRTIDSTVSVEQDQVNTYSVNHILQAGRQFFAVDFLEEDGHGEGALGPRSGQRAVWWSGAGLNNFPFLRVNGIDSQSCFACHNSAGTAVPEGELFRTQKVGSVGGAADIASVLLLNSDFPDTASEVTAESLTHIVRTPPRAFGSAYIQELALEMTEDLEEIVQDAIAEASQSQGTPVTKDLITKGVDYGTVTVVCGFAGCDQTRNVDGIQRDLIVRPFQNKGVATTVRGFTKTALDFHHSLQGVEVVGIDLDCDADGFINEMGVDITTPAGNASATQVQQSLGNVLALSAFTGMLRPPTESSPTPHQAAVGEELFAHIGCADCHVRELPLRPDPQFRIELNEPAEECPDDTCGPYGCFSQLGSFAEVDSAIHPAKEAAQLNQAAKTANNGVLPATFCPSGFYCIDLNAPGSGLPGDFNPRLPANKDGSVDVPLYSDLKRHDLGSFLAQTNPPQRDDVGKVIPNEEWLTQKLWGVKDNGPWLHDGRARTLREAIVMHAGANGGDTSSDAHPAVQGFLGLTPTQQGYVLTFLDSLTIPLPQ